MSRYLINPSLCTQAVACDPYWSYVSLLLHMDGADGSTVVNDSGPDNISIGLYAGGSIQNATTLLSGGALSLNGTTSYAQVGYFDGAYIVGDDFTLELWVRPAVTISSYTALVENRSAFAAEGYVLLLDPSGHAVFYAGDNNTSAWEVTLTSTTVLAANTTYAVAVVRSGSTWSLYINGTREATASWGGSIGYGVPGNNLFNIGKFRDSTGWFNGLLDSLRLTILARYSGSSYAVPTAAFGGVNCWSPIPSPSPDPYFGNVVALFHFDGSDGSTTITDVKGHAVTRAGNTQLKTAQKQFGASSVYFDGVGDQFYILPSAGDLNIFTGDFTVELWFRPDTVPTNSCLVEFGYDVSNRANLSLVNGVLVFASIVGGGGGVAITATRGSPALEWSYAALTCTSSVYTLRLNGEIMGTASPSVPTHATTVMTVGRSHMASANDYAGFIDELRVTKGVDRYSGNYINQLTAFADS